MRKFGQESIQNIIKCACKEFMEDDSAPNFVSFFYKGHYVRAKFEWHPIRPVWYISQFAVVYSRCVMLYLVGRDYDMSSSLCC